MCENAQPFNNSAYQLVMQSEQRACWQESTRSARSILQTLHRFVVGAAGTRKVEVFNISVSFVPFCAPSAIAAAKRSRRRPNWRAVKRNCAFIEPVTLSTTRQSMRYFRSAALPDPAEAAVGCERFIAPVIWPTSTSWNWRRSARSAHNSCTLDSFVG